MWSRFFDVVKVVSWDDANSNRKSIERLSIINIESMSNRLTNEIAYYVSNFFWSHKNQKCVQLVNFNSGVHSNLIQVSNEQKRS